MRTWRVGTISMGMTLIFLGIFLVLSQLLDWKPSYAMISWWPIILIVLGVEILIYLILAKQDTPIVKYDLFSIFFVGVIGFIGIVFAIVSATGIFDKIHDWTNYEVKTIDLPTYSTKLDETITRVVVDTGSEPLTIETGITSEVAVFGTYVTEAVKGKTPIEASDDYLFTEQKGDTLFINFKMLPQTLSPFGYHSERSTTMIIPDDVEVEIEANHQPLYVNSRSLMNDWTVMNAMDLNLNLSSELDVTLNVENVEHIKNNDKKWKIESIDDEEEFDHVQSGTFQLGKGTHIMNITDVMNIAVTTK